MALRRIEQDWYAVADQLEAADRRDRERLRKLLAESVLAAEPLFLLRPWFLSDQFSLLDVSVAPILWRLPHWGIDLGDRAPSVERYANKLFARTSFRAGLSGLEQDMRRGS